MVASKTIGPWMKKNVVVIDSSATLLEAAKLLAEKRVGTLPVVDDGGMLIGVTTMREIVKMFLPDFVSLLGDVDFVRDYGALEELSDEDIQKANSLTVAEIMEKPIALEHDCSLVRALSVMSAHSVPDLIVTQDDKPVGIVSRVDLGRAFLETWLKMGSAVK